MDAQDFTVSDVARFWSKVDRSDPDGCWEWQAKSRHTDGYGLFKFRGEMLRGHSVAATLAYHERPALNVLHTCDNPPCCNPNRLFLASTAANNRDRSMKGRSVKGAASPHAKLTEADVLMIRSDPRSAAELARVLGVSWGLIGHVRRGRAWRHLL